MTDTMTETAVAVNALYSEQELKKDSQVSVRLESGLFEALETQTEVFQTCKQAYPHPEFCL